MLTDVGASFVRLESSIRESWWDSRTASGEILDIRHRHRIDRSHWPLSRRQAQQQEQQIQALPIQAAMVKAWAGSQRA
jgi:hypothetical protein